MSVSRFFVPLFIVLVLMLSPTKAMAVSKSSSGLKNQQYSTWLWETSRIVQEQDEIINFVAINNVKNLYLQIDYAMNIEYYKSFIKKASTKNINVYALDGSSDWVSDDGINKEQMFFDWLSKYQRTSLTSEKFKGVHLDVEPYLNVQYNSNKNRIFENYQSSLLNALNKSKVLGLSLSIDIPFWFDELSYSTKYGSGVLAEWVIKNVKNVTIMAYRDSAAGDNGIISLVSKELSFAKQYGSTAAIAVETQKSFEGDNISFYEEGQTYMNKELDKVYASYKGNSSFGGFAIHHVISWMSLKK